MFCSKCGKELPNDAVICTGCGCVVNSAPGSTDEKVEIIKASEGSLFGKCMLSGLIFGLIFGVFMAFQDSGLFLPIFLVGSLIFGLIMYAAMQIATSKLEDTHAKKKREEISKQKRILFEGPANRDGNGGWLFVTDSSIEHHAHNTNFDAKSTVLEISNIVSIRKGGNKLIIVTTQYTHTFVVDNIDRWMYRLSNNENTGNKINRVH